MTQFFKITAITGQEFLVRPNYRAKTFTIKTNGTTYRTTSLNGQEFEECEYYTGNDWASFMKSGNYYKVK